MTTEKGWASERTGTTPESLSVNTSGGSHTRQRPRRAGERRSVVSWALAQAFIALGLFFSLAVGWLVQMARGRFHYRAFVASWALMLAGVSAVGAALWLEPVALAEHPDAVLWGGTMATFLIAGAAAGRVARRIGFWEIYLATLLTTAMVVVHLLWGWHVLLGIGEGANPSYLEFMGNARLGETYLGQLWGPQVAFAAVVGFLVALAGGSFAFLIYSDTGRRDSGMELEWMVAIRHLRGRTSSLVSITAVVVVTGIALGVAALVAVTAVMSGYQEDIQEKILTTNAHIVIQKYGIDFSEYDEIIATAMDMPGVVAAAPFTFNEAMLSAGNHGVGVLLKGVVAESSPKVTGVAENLCQPSRLPESCIRYPSEHAHQALAEALTPHDGVPGLVVGSELFKRIGLPLGSPISLTTPIGIAGGRGSAPKRMQMRIAGVFRSGMHEFDARLSYLSLQASQRLMGMGDAVNGVELRIADPESVDTLTPQILRAVGRYPYHTLDWRELNSGIFTALKLQKVVMFLVLTFIIIVASFNIASTLFMAVVEKAHEIGVLKSMGARDASVMKVFVLQGWLTGSVGTCLGLVLGLAVAGLIGKLEIPIAADVYMVESLQVRVEPLEVLLTVVAALGISHLATLYPALRAARQSPVDAMRYD